MFVRFDPPPGLNSDDTSFSAGGRWADGSNVRFVNGKPQAIEAINPLPNNALDLLSGCRGVFVWRRGNSTHVAVATYNSLLASVDVVTPLASIHLEWAAREQWALDNFGEFLLAAGSGGKLYQWTGSGPATEVVNAPDQITWMLVTPERQVLAFGCNEEVSGVFNSRCIRGSNLEDHTDWTTSPTNNAFEHILDGAGEIVAARMIGSYVAVWTTTALYLGQFVGDPSQTYRFDRVEDNCGLLNPRAVAVSGHVAYWVGTDRQFRSWTVGGRVVIVPCPINIEFQKYCTQDPQSLAHLFVAERPRYGEIWVCYRDTRDATAYAENSRYIAYCERESARAQTPVWYRGILAISAILDSDMVNSALEDLVGITTAGLIFEDNGSGGFGLATTGISSSYIQSADQYLNDSNTRMIIRSIEPDFEEQDGDVSLTLYVRSRPREAAIIKGPFTLTTTATKKGTRAAGRLVSVRFSASSVNFRLGTPLFDIVPLGER